MPFLKRRPKEKEEAMLSWILKSEINLTSVMDGNVTILKDDIKLHHMLPTKILGENINIARVKKYFSPEAWQTLKVALSSKRDNAEWNCTVCDTDVNNAASLVCDGCLEWFHQKCERTFKLLSKKAKTDLEQPPKERFPLNE
ncbi:uncharacterized protein LOC134688005 [Mytilus trossulus]|uniref:uncharacterized protein LOC134688005 n=1 Tax=Mytilus trossulus TaxID=6551 RepID=UPI003007E2C5